MHDDEHYGLMIASNGRNMHNGFEELWNMVVQQNVKTITSLNEKFQQDKEQIDNVYMYFPDDMESKFQVGESFNIVIDKKIQNMCQTTRILNIQDYTSGKCIHQVKHIHFNKWDDFSVPSEECAHELMNILEDQSSHLMN